MEVWVYTGNPSVVDSTYPYFLERLSQFTDPGIRYLVGTTGGTPALNMALFLAGLDRLEDMVSLSVREDSAQPLAVGIGRRLKERDVINAIVSHLRHRDFHAALDLLSDNEGIPSDGRLRRFCTALLRHAHHRCCFRFADAAKALSDALPDAPDDEAREAASRLLDQAAALEQADLTPGDAAVTVNEGLRLREMLRLAEQYLERGLYLELPALVYTFSDVALNLLADRLGVQFIRQDKEGGWRRLDPDWAAAQPGLLAYLEDSGTKPSSLSGGFNTYMALRLMRWYAERDVSMAQQVWTDLNALEQVRALRNRGPFGHGTVGVSEREIKKAYRGGSNAVLDALRRVADQLAPDTAENPFDLVAEQVLRLLRPGRDGSTAEVSPS